MFRLCHGSDQDHVWCKESVWNCSDSAPRTALKHNTTETGRLSWSRQPECKSSRKSRGWIRRVWEKKNKKASSQPSWCWRRPKYLTALFRPFALTMSIRTPREGLQEPSTKSKEDTLSMDQFLNKIGKWKHIYNLITLHKLLHKLFCSTYQIQKTSLPNNYTWKKKQTIRTTIWVFIPMNTPMTAPILQFL